MSGRLEDTSPMPFGCHKGVYMQDVPVGKPNYRERKFIALCKEAGEPFPVKKTQWRR